MAKKEAFIDMPENRKFAEREFGDYSTVVDFRTFLLCAFALKNGQTVGGVQLDDKKMLSRT